MDRRVAENIVSAFSVQRLAQLLGYDKKSRLPMIPVFSLKEFEDRLEKSLPILCSDEPSTLIQERSYKKTMHFDSFEDFMTRGQNEGVIVRHNFYPVWYLVDKLKHTLNLEHYDYLVFWDSAVVMASIKTGQGNGKSLWLSPRVVMNSILSIYGHLLGDFLIRHDTDRIPQPTILVNPAYSGYWPIIAFSALVITVSYYSVKSF